MDSLQPILNRHASELLPTFLKIFIFIYAILTASHLLLLPDKFVIPMTLLAASSVVLGLLLQFFADKVVVSQNAEYVMVVVLIFMGLNSMAHLYFSADVKQTTNVIFVMAIGGYVLPGYRPFYVMIMGLLASWLLIVSFGPAWTQEAIHFGFAMVLGAMFSVFLHTMRRSQLKQLRDLENTITQLNASKVQVAAGESLLQNLIDHVPAGITVRDSTSKLLYANEQAKLSLNVTGNNLMNKTLIEIPIKLFGASGKVLEPEQYPSMRVLRTGEPVANEIFGIEGENGEIIWGLLSAFLLVPVGTKDQLVVLVFIDISERIKTEQQLQESEDRASAILNSVVEGVISVDQHDVVTLFNPGAQAMTGYDEEEALGRDLDEVFHFEEDELARLASIDSELAASFKQGVLFGAEGNELQIELLASDISGQGNAGGRVLTLRDVTAQVRMEQELAMVDKMSSVGVLAGGIAHDFNNLLTAIYGNVAMAEASIDSRELALDYLKRTGESLQLATNLTKQLLTFSTGSEPVRNVVDVERMVRDATGFALSGSSIAVSFDIEVDLARVEVDAGQMQQAIGNIILNAKQALDDVGRITISAKNFQDSSAQGGSFVSICISDNGPGIDSQTLPRIFDPYFTTKSAGTGLGLATTHSIITKHGGSISVEATKISGTRFTILLPSSSAVDQIDLTSQPFLPDTTRSLSVLVMDDEAVVLETVSKLLEHLGHKPFGTTDGTQAIAQYKSRLQKNEPFDLVIMDLTVAGGMGGKESAAGILELDPGATLIVISGYSAGAEMARFKELGFSARLEKPFRSIDLKRVIEEVMSTEIAKLS